MRSRPPTSYEPTSTAFVTFRDPRQARMVWRELNDQIVVKVRLAPEVKDLDWDRLMKTSFTGDVVRGFGVSVVIWAFTIFWVIIVTLSCSVCSASTSSSPSRPWQLFQRQIQTHAFVTVTLPPLLVVSLASMSVPRAHLPGQQARTGLRHVQCALRHVPGKVLEVCHLQRCHLLQRWGHRHRHRAHKVGSPSTIVNDIGFAFPSAAPFFVSYLILQLALQSGFEHSGFMIALLQHWGARKAATPGFVPSRRCRAT